MQKVRRVGMGIVLGAGLMLAVSACGVDSSAVASRGGSPVVVEAGAPAGLQGAALIVRAATQTSSLTTGQFAGSGSLTGRLAATVSIAGSFDRTAQSATVTATFGPEGDGKTFTSTFVGGTAYLQTGSISMLGIDTPWLSLDVAKLADKLAADPNLDGLFPEGSGPAAGSNPDSFLDVLRGVSGDVTTVGPETVRGEPTTHYRADVLPSKALDQLPADHQAALRRMLGAELDQPIPVDVWIDGGGLVRKVSASRSIGTSGSVSGEFEFFALGTPVSIAAPPADQVTRAEDLPFLRGLFGN